MTQQDATPVTRPGLRVVTGDVTAPAATAPEAVTDPVTTGAVVPMTLPERGRLAVARWGGNALGAVRELWLHPERPVHALWHGKPGSFAEHFSYVASRAWVPEELTGKKAGFIAWAGFAYHVLIAWPLKTAAKVIDAAADRPLRLLCLIAFTVALCLFLPI